MASVSPRHCRFPTEKGMRWSSLLTPPAASRKRSGRNWLPSPQWSPFRKYADKCGWTIHWWAPVMGTYFFRRVITSCCLTDYSLWRVFVFLALVYASSFFRCVIKYFYRVKSIHQLKLVSTPIHTHSPSHPSWQSKSTPPNFFAFVSLTHFDLCKSRRGYSALVDTETCKQKGVV